MDWLRLTDLFNLAHMKFTGSADEYLYLISDDEESRKILKENTENSLPGNIGPPGISLIYFFKISERGWNQGAVVF